MAYNQDEVWITRESKWNCEFFRIINVTRFLPFTVWFCNPGFRGCCWVLLWFGFYAVSRSYITLGVKIFCSSFIQVGIYRVLLLKVILVQVSTTLITMFSVLPLSLFIITFGKLIGWFLLYFIFSHKVITFYANFVHGLGGSDKRCYCRTLLTFYHVRSIENTCSSFLEFLAYGIVM